MQIVKQVLYRMHAWATMSLSIYDWLGKIFSAVGSRLVSDPGYRAQSVLLFTLYLREMRWIHTLLQGGICTSVNIRNLTGIWTCFSDFLFRAVIHYTTHTFKFESKPDYRLLKKKLNSEQVIQCSDEDIIITI